MPSRREEIERIIADAEQEGYARGWRDAIGTITAAAAAAAPKLSQPELTTSNPKIETPNAAKIGRLRGRPPRAIGLVRDMITARPGLKGAQIATALAAAGTPVIERTVRSCLHRLKNNGEIRQHKGVWYSATKETAENTDGEAVGSLPH